MSLLKHFRRLMFIDFLIRRKATGNLQSFAAKNRLSKRGLLNVLQDMKALGYDIQYNRIQQTYYYREEKSSKLKLNLANMPGAQVLSREQLRTITGGPTGLSEKELCFSPTEIFERC